MELENLTIVPAGAGSGKTTRIVDCLSKWITSGKVQPEKIIAVTFTEAAAGELRERIRFNLAQENSELVHKLDRAYITTFHGLGIRLLEEYAFDAGVSPTLRSINEDEQNSLISRMIGISHEAEHIISDLGRYGFTGNFFSGTSGGDQFSGTLLQLGNLIRSIKNKKQLTQIEKRAIDDLEKVYMPRGENTSLAYTLKSAVENLLGKFPKYDDVKKVNGNQKHSDSFSKGLKNNYYLFSQALDVNTLQNNWDLWLKLSEGLKKSSAKIQLSPGYDEHIQAISAAANAIHHHPGPLEDAITLLKALFATLETVLNAYQKEKAEAGLLDYSDMISHALRLFDDKPEILTDIKNNFDSLIVDEFQDTNPEQFSLVWRLHEAGLPMYIVGDRKQAIMRFQGADSRLMEQVEKKFTDHLKPLTDNYRLDPELMYFVNNIGEKLIEGYQPLSPKGKERSFDPERGKAIELLEATENASRGSFAFHLAKRLKSMLQEKPNYISGEGEGTKRLLKGEDIAVLCRTSFDSIVYAQAFRKLGLKCRMLETGWLDSRIIEIMRYIMAYVADETDQHAAIYLAVTELGSLNLQDAFQKHLSPTDDLNDQLLEKLDEIRKETTDLPLNIVIERSIHGLGLYDVLSRWPDADQQRANLLMLEGRVQEFLNSDSSTLAVKDIFGKSSQAFWAWLDTMDEGQHFIPKENIVDENAINIVTWHGAKGREWPVVAITCTDKAISPRYPEMDTVYGNFDDLSTIVENAHIRYVPTFASKEVTQRFNEKLFMDALVEDNRCQLYVAMTRAKEKLLIEWPDHLDGNENVTPYSILKKAGLSTKDGGVFLNDENVASTIHKVEKNFPEEDALLSGDIKLANYGRRALQFDCAYNGHLTPETQTPSQMKEMDVPQVSFIVSKYAEPLSAVLPIEGAERGEFLHRCLELLTAGKDMEVIMRSTNTILTKDVREAIVQQTRRFEQYLQEELKPLNQSCEVPFVYEDTHGSVVTGMIDLLVETKDGFWIIDHKSDQIEDVTERLKGYTAQLNSYKFALEKSGHTVIGMGINWISKGEFTIVT